MATLPNTNPHQQLQWSLNHLLSHPTALHSARQRAIADSASIFAQNADQLPLIINTLANCRNNLHNDVALPSQALLKPHSLLTQLSQPSTPTPHIHSELLSIQASWSLLSELQASQDHLILLLSVPDLVNTAIQSLHPSAKNALDSLNPLVDAILSIDSTLMGIARRFNFVNSSSVDSSGVITDVSNRTHHLISTELPKALIAHLQSLHTSLPTILRVVAHLRRIHPAATVDHESKWAHLFIKSRIQNLPPPPDTYSSTLAIAWIDKTRAHMFDTWALTRVVFPVHVGVYVFAIQVANQQLIPALKTMLSKVHDRDLGLVARHLCSALGSACRRLGWDLAVPVLRPLIDFEWCSRFVRALNACTDTAVTRLAKIKSVNDLPSIPDGFDSTLPHTWTFASTTTSALHFVLVSYASECSVAILFATGSRIPVSQLPNMSMALNRSVLEIVNALSVHKLESVWLWDLAVRPYVKYAWDRVVDACHLSVDHCSQFRIAA